MNINDHVWVRLTPFGKAALKNNWERFWIGHRNARPYIPPTEDAQGWSKHQLWHLFEEFGPHIHLGMTQTPFVENEIRFEKPPTLDLEALAQQASERLDKWITCRATEHIGDIRRRSADYAAANSSRLGIATFSGLRHYIGALGN